MRTLTDPTYLVKASDDHLVALIAAKQIGVALQNGIGHHPVSVKAQVVISLPVECARRREHGREKIEMGDLLLSEPLHEPNRKTW